MPVDGGWPRAYAAVGYEAKSATKAALGSIEAATKVAVSDRLVDFSPLQITESNFPTLKKEEMREVVAEIDKSIPNEERVIALDRVLAHVDKSQILIADVPVRRPAASAGAILRGTRT